MYTLIINVLAWGSLSHGQYDTPLNPKPQNLPNPQLFYSGPAIPGLCKGYRFQELDLHEGTKDAIWEPD